MKRLFAIGDIHGCFDSFKELVENHIMLSKEDKIVLLGDYIDRGGRSKDVVDYIILLRKNGFDITPLIGNHEVLLLDAYNIESNYSIWIQNGGLDTLKSFGIESVKDVPSCYIDFFSTLPFYYLFENHLFVHAGFNDSILNPFKDSYSMVWKSKSVYCHPLLEGKTIIHGHRPISVDFCNKQFEDNISVINIDTGCVYKGKEGYGRLTAIELYSRKLFSI
ncbi:serine/threonine protein phosphatase 1 [Breznakibacter xylanolyticus]|uniref:Serine/threonine protein phosphatase 1 n=1 Tax=Breznakibacter xylanolyticus TaxID=990 RepID=A0A2W7P3K3_9BACT|nr:metallophosphoesterase [Breznakibacter xylanolyticus]PZX19996.1 serine/threonine protein phosphatase 1 [Breznakibacter xylanolyticus]